MDSRSSLPRFPSGGKFYRVWGLANQLYLIIKSVLHSIGDTGNMEFVKAATIIIGWLRRKDTLIRRMDSKYPYYINVRWTSFSKLLQWFLANRNTVCAFFMSNQYAYAPPQEWFLVSMVAQHFLPAVKITFCAFQTDSAVFSKQYDNMQKLLLQLQEHFSADRDESLYISVLASIVATLFQRVSSRLLSAACCGSCNASTSRRWISLLISPLSN